MKVEIMRAVAARLKEMGLDAHFEYPGHIACIYVGKGLVCGDANEFFACDVMDEPNGWECVKSINSTIPSDSTDVEAVAEFIRDCAREDRCQKCGASTGDGEGWNGLCGNCADVADPQQAGIREAEPATLCARCGEPTPEIELLDSISDRSMICAKCAAKEIAQ